MRTIYLIGGAPGAGKSTVAKQLSAHLGIPWISTDQIRRILNSDGPSSQEKIDLTWDGMLRFLKGVDPWEEGIIEGVDLMPTFIKRDLGDSNEIKTVFLIQTEEHIAKIIGERAKLPWINTKTLEQQAEKIKEVSAINKTLKSEAAAAGYPVVEAHTENTFNEILKVFGLS